MLTLGSLFDGSGGFPLAGAICGIMPVWASEIEPFPLKVTTARFPDVKQLGDVTQINGAKIKPVDIITFGSPCQDLSVAGKRAGIHDGERSSLFFEATRIIHEMRGATNGVYPTFAVWENVPGAFSSNKGNDFRLVLEALASISEPEVSIPMPEKGKWQRSGEIVGDGWSIAWRTLDAQFWGVPQRRKRIYLVADFRGERAGEILFEQEGLRRDSAESGTAGQGAAGDAQGSAGRGVWPVISGSLCARADSSPCVDRGQPFIVLNVCYPIDSHQQDSRFKICEDGVCPTVPGHMGTGGNNGPMVLETTKPPRKYIIRRLTPLECCRLQGFPDWWTEGVDGSDSAVYKMWGNGIALPCAVFVLGQIAKD